MEYVKVPLGVEARFYTDGSVFPLRLRYAARVYTVDRILSSRPHNPGTVSCVAPIEYVVMVEGQTKKLYFEPESRQWFSIRERKTQGERPFNVRDK